MPFTKTKVKFKQGRAAKKVKDLYSGYGYSGADAMAIIRCGNKIKDRLRSFRIRINTGTVLNSYQGEYMSQYSWAEYSIFKRNK